MVGDTEIEKATEEFNGSTRAGNSGYRL